MILYVMVCYEIVNDSIHVGTEGCEPSQINYVKSAHFLNNKRTVEININIQIDIRDLSFNIIHFSLLTT